MDVPLVGDFHYIGHKLLPIIRPAPRRWRNTASIPAMSASRTRRTSSSPTSSRWRSSYDKPVRIGVNWGSLDQELLTKLMDENAAPPARRCRRAQVTREAIVQSALMSAAIRAEEIGLPRNRIILSAKVGQVQDLIAVYSMLSSAPTMRCISA
jgi:(E)-4-hydroxy-3-methylbut-2-enyl-diphosphate synthase